MYHVETLTFDEEQAVRRALRTGEPPTDVRLAHVVIERTRNMKRTYPDGWKGILLPLGLSAILLGLVALLIVGQHGSVMVVGVCLICPGPDPVTLPAPTSSAPCSVHVPIVAPVRFARYTGDSYLRIVARVERVV